MNTALEVLIAARARIERGWCQGASARTSDGRAVSSRDDAAVSWCFLGATYCFDEPSERAKAASILTRIAEKPPFSWNDSKERTKKEVLKVYDLAIELAKASVQP